MGALVNVVLGLPRAPRLDRVLDRRCDVAGPRRPWLGCFDRRPAQHEAETVACLDREGAHQHVIVHDELDRGRESEPVGAAQRDRPSLYSPQQRPAEAVFGARNELQLERDASAHSLDEPKHLVRCREPELVSALAAGEGEGVDYPCTTLARLEGRLEDERSRNVATARPPAAGGPKRPVAGVGIEDSSEHGRAVEAGEAEPVDRAVPPDERGRVAVGEEAVLAHRCGCFFLRQGDRLVDD
jgi:hypothetical protein